MIKTVKAYKIALAMFGVTHAFSATAVNKVETKCTALQGFCSSIAPLTDDQAKAMIGVVWQKGCPVPLSDLRTVTASYKTFQGFEAIGSVVVHHRYAKPMQQALRQLYESNFPIESMAPMEVFGGDDERSRLANNTSVFNCRRVKGTRVYSEHAYGRAIDINPLQNPFVKLNEIKNNQTNGKFFDRASVVNKPGVIYPQSVPVKAFRQMGWAWGGYWRGNKDYQHFCATNR
jgi:D-alanyl-D-alanine carboxypeptidase